MNSGPSQRNWRLLLDGAADGPRNMAVDEALLCACAAGLAPPTLRLYRWDGPILSIGYFQDAGREIDLEKCRALGVEVVRRPSGGKAVLHECDLSFAIAVGGRCNPFAGRTSEGLLRVGRCLLEAVRRCGADARFASSEDLGRYSSHRSSGPGCFQTLHPHEVVVEGHKIAGIAQARRQGGVLIHGSIQLSYDRKLLQSVLRLGGNGKGLEGREPLPIADLRDPVQGTSTVRDLSGALVRSMEEDLGVSIRPGALSRRESSMVDNLVGSKYTTAGWNMECVVGMVSHEAGGRRKEGRMPLRTC